MNEMRPKGQVIEIGGEERHLLFTLNAIEEIQDTHDCSVDEMINKLTDKKESYRALRSLVAVLLNDEAEREKAEGKEMRTYSEKEVGWMISQENAVEVTIAVLKAYGLSLPEPDEFTSPNVEGRRSE